jgi:hypothetical protein
MGKGSGSRGAGRQPVIPMLQLTRELEDYRRFKQENQPLEMVYLRLRTLIQKARESLRAAPGDREVQDHLRRLEEERDELERQAPWLTADYPVEMALWGPGSGLL